MLHALSTAINVGCQQHGAAVAAYTIGVVLQNIKHFGGWAEVSIVVLNYINPMALPCAASWQLFGWLTHDSDVTKLWEVQRDDCPHAPHEHAEVYDNKVPQSVKAVMRPFIMCDKPGQAIAKLPREVREKIRDYDGFRTAVRA
eukprot:jgi/Tetstr1/431657/TSEL_021186.t1